MKNLLKKSNFLIAFLVLVMTVCVALGTMAFTSSSYVTSVNQYADVATTTPAKLKGEVQLSFYYKKNTTSLPDDGTSYRYLESTYSDEKNISAMKIDNTSNITDYFGTALSDSSSSASDYFNFFGVVKADNDYGTLTYDSDSTTYTTPLCTQLDVGSKTASSTTLSITPFYEDVQITIYFAMSYTSGNDAKTRDYPFTAFNFNGDVIQYDKDGGTDTSDGLVKYAKKDTVSYSTGFYSYATGDGDNKNVDNYELYSYTTTVDAETAINIATATQSQTMIFLISLSPVKALTLIDGDGESGTGADMAVSGSTSTRSLTATATKTSGANSDISAVWASSDSSIVEITSGSTSPDTTASNTLTYNATITAKGLGTATVYAMVGGVVKTYQVTVAGVQISGDNSITVNQSTPLSVDYVGTGTVSSYTWSSSDTSVATVSGSGTSATVEGVAAGTATITVTAKNSSDVTLGTDTLVITVTDYITLSAETATIYTPATSGTSIGNTLQLTATSSSSSITWSSDNTGAATVDSNGLVTGVAVGEATITATTFSEVSATCTVTVANLVTLDNSTVTVYMDSTNTVTVNVADGITSFTSSTPSYAWALSDIDNTTASVGDCVSITNGTGTQTVTLAGNSQTAGTATLTVTVTIDSAEYTLTCAVTVEQEPSKVIYTINESANGSTNTLTANAFDASETVDSNVLSITGYGIKYSKSSVYEGYTSRAEFKTSRYAVITVGTNTTISKITVYASASESDNILYISTTNGNSGTSVVSGSGTSTFTISVENLSDGTYYIWASDSVYVYAIEIEYTVSS